MDFPRLDKVERLRAAQTTDLPPFLGRVRALVARREREERYIMHSVRSDPAAF